jgi:hypothetical protein
MHKAQNSISSTIKNRESKRDGILNAVLFPLIVTVRVNFQSNKTQDTSPTCNSTEFLMKSEVPTLEVFMMHHYK